jgi:hypothetical protein
MIAKSKLKIGIPNFLKKIKSKGEDDLAGESVPVPAVPVPASNHNLASILHLGPTAAPSEGSQPLPSDVLVKRLSFSDIPVNNTNMEIDCGADKKSTIRVYLRVRPLSVAEKKRVGEDANTITIVDDNTVVVKAPEGSHGSRSADGTDTFSFDRVFPPSSDQESVFSNTLDPIVKDMVNGVSGLLFAYGITNAGKTFTVMGDKENPGLLPRTLKHLFDVIRSNMVSGMRCRCAVFCILLLSYSLLPLSC